MRAREYLLAMQQQQQPILFVLPSLLRPCITIAKQTSLQDFSWISSNYLLKKEKRSFLGDENMLLYNIIRICIYTFYNMYIAYNVCKKKGLKPQKAWPDVACPHECFDIPRRSVYFRLLSLSLFLSYSFYFLFL